MEKNNEKSNIKRDSLNYNFITLILSNFQSDIKIKSIIATKNSIFQNFYFSNLKLYIGQWDEINPLSGEGTFHSNEVFYEGVWNERNGKGVIYKNKEYFYSGEWYELRQTNGSGSIYQDEHKFVGEWKNSLFEGIISHSLHPEYEYEGTEYFSTLLNGEGRIYKHPRILIGKWTDSNAEGRIIDLENEDVIFEGIWKTSFFLSGIIVSSGMGTIIEDKNRYTGVWRTDETNFGEILSPTGEIWKGRWDSGFWPLDGIGTFTSSNLVTYQGKWISGRGEGLATSGPNNEYVYKGVWDKYGYFTNGFGSVIDLHGKVFEGKWSHFSDEPSEGYIHFPNGEKLKAKWDYTKRIVDGDGVYYDEDNRKYIGRYRKEGGEGKIYSLNNNCFVYEGSWNVDGIPETGEGIFVFQGIIFKGKWVNGIGKGIILS